MIFCSNYIELEFNRDPLSSSARRTTLPSSSTTEELLSSTIEKALASTQEASSSTLELSRSTEEPFPSTDLQLRKSHLQPSKTILSYIRASLNTEELPFTVQKEPESCHESLNNLCFLLFLLFLGFFYIFTYCMNYQQGMFGICCLFKFCYKSNSCLPGIPRIFNCSGRRFSTFDQVCKPHVCSINKIYKSRDIKFRQITFTFHFFPMPEIPLFWIVIGKLDTPLEAII